MVFVAFLINNKDFSINLPLDADIKWIVRLGPTVGSHMMIKTISWPVGIKKDAVTSTASSHTSAQMVSVFQEKVNQSQP